MKVVDCETNIVLNLQRIAFIMAQHDVSNGDKTAEFPNDVSSKNYVEKQAADADQAEKAAKALQNDLQELNRLREENPKLKAGVLGLNDRRMIDGQTIENLRGQLETLRQKYDKAVTKLPPDNNLDPECHGRFAQIFLLRPPHVAIDLGHGA